MGLLNWIQRHRSSPELTRDEFMNPSTSRRTALGEVIRNAKQERQRAALLTSACNELIDAGQEFHKAVLRGDTRAQAAHYKTTRRIRRKIMELEGLGCRKQKSF